jgi:hypothetical protein
MTSLGGLEDFATVGEGLSGKIGVESVYLVKSLSGVNYYQDDEQGEDDY